MKDQSESRPLLSFSCMSVSLDYYETRMKTKDKRSSSCVCLSGCVCVCVCLNNTLSPKCLQEKCTCCSFSVLLKQKGT